MLNSNGKKIYFKNMKKYEPVRIELYCELPKQIEELNLISKKLVESERRLSKSQEIGNTGNWELDLATNKIWASREAFLIYGLTSEDGNFPFKDIQMMVVKEDRAKLDNALKLLVENNLKYDVEFKIYNATIKEERYIHSIAELEYDESGKPIRVLGVIHDITMSKKNEDIIKHMAYYDDLTGLPNRVFFFENLKHEIDIIKENGNKIVILYIDMDNFKMINDSLGHAFGDKLLKEAALRLKKCMRECDTIARISGDEFTVLIKNIHSVDESLPIINCILKVFSDSFNIGNSSINMTSSIGASVFPNDGEVAEDLIRSADIAMYKAKNTGKCCYQFFNIGMKHELLRKLNIEVLLRKGITEKEFVLYYQPQFYAKTKELRGFEALLRWNSFELGFLTPAEFIPIAEETGLISIIGEWVIKAACEFSQKISRLYGCNVIMAVNISPIQLKQIDFFDIVTRIIDKSGINPSNLEIEVTENIFIENFDLALQILNDLKNYGVRIALDDFGTGYS
ncbi:MAG: diguanylate cyclase, partial [Clostridiaceae bacterium]|nr:diguanylate cyclase [Clostridiaceae bacterium]